MPFNFFPMKTICKVLSLFCFATSFAQNTIPIPDTLVGTNISLTLHIDSIQILSGKKTATLAYNSGFNFLGPTLILNKWQSINTNIINISGDTTTLHWHGLHVASAKDGGPFTLIMNGNTWSPSFTMLNSASMFWYHPHFMGKTAAQVIKGASGMIIIRDSAEAALNLPRKYGVDDIPVIVKSVQLDGNNQFMPTGMQDSILLVNGVTNPQYNLPAQVVRLRLINASGERTFNFGFTASTSFYVIGGDGGLLNAPVLVTRKWLSPGERAEVLLDLTGMNGQTIYLMSYGAELPMGVQGGPTMVMSGGPPMNSPLNGVNFNLLQINVSAQTANPVTTIPTSLLNLVPLVASQASITRYINFTADSMMVMDGPFYFNDSTYNMMRIDYQIPLNNIEIWSLNNQTMVAHPFHIHDVQFYILDRDGNSPPPEERGLKDVVFVQPNETVRFITKFTDFVDSIIPYMYHCHILMHEDDGMMGQFVIMPQSWTGITEHSVKQNETSVYPNPAGETLNINLSGFDVSQPIQINILDALGKTVYSTSVSKQFISLIVSDWSRGFYTVSLLQKQKNIHKKFIKE
jgi:blue copper oxidase